MNVVSKVISVLLPVALLPGLQSCIYENMRECPGEYFVHLFVSNDWMYAPDASPEGMACIFFPEDNGKPWRFDISGRNGGEVRLPNEDYHFVTINDDYSSIIFENADSYSEISVTTPTCELFYGAGEAAAEAKLPSSRKSQSGTAKEDVRQCPDMLWSNSIEKVDIAPGELSYSLPDGAMEHQRSSSASSVLRLLAYPRPIVSRYHVRIADVGNLDGVAMMCGSMSGLASSVRLSDNRHSPDPVTVPFTLDKAGDSTISGDFLTFGRTSGTDHDNMLSLFVWLRDGTKLEYDFDVTSLIIRAEDPFDVWINIKGHDLPESGPASGTFDVNVDNWNTIEIEIND